jgi:hypothetical protein
MPKRRGMLFWGEDISHVTGKKKINVGETTTPTYLKDLNKSMYLNQDVSPHFMYGKIHFRKTSLREGKRKAQRVFLKPVVGSDHKEQRKNAKKEVFFLNILGMEGVPVPKAGVVNLNGQPYVAMSPFLRKGNSKSVLVPINTKHGHSEPYFLRKLSVRKNSELIQGLARDLAAVANSGLSTNYFDLHGFYKRRDGSFTRIVMDVNHLHREYFDSYSVRSVAAQIKKVWRGPWFKKERQLFVTTLLENIHDRTTRERFRVAFAEVSFWKLLKESF